MKRGGSCNRGAPREVGALRVLFVLTCTKLDEAPLSTNLSPMPTVLELELIRLRQMSAAEKLSVSAALWQEAWALRRASIARQHPDWPAPQVEQATREAMTGGRG